MVDVLGQIYEGKAKKVFKTSDPQVYMVYFKDDATAFNGLKKGTIPNKGCYNNQISAHFFRLLTEKGIPNHFIETTGERNMLVKKLEIIPVEVVVRNIIAGSLAKRLGLAEGTRPAFPVLEFYYKNDELADPMINDYHIRALNLASDQEVAAIKEMAAAINKVLLECLAALQIELIDFKLEFGRFNGQVMLGDEISPDTCRFWDVTTGEKLDKDRFRRGLGKVEEAYREIYDRLSGGIKQCIRQ